MIDVQVMLVVIALWGEAEELLKIPMTTLAECESYARLWNAQLPGVDASCVLVQRSVKVATWFSQDPGRVRGERGLSAYP